MRDFLPAEVKAREKVLSTVRGVFESYGFAPLETPAIERLEILQAWAGENDPARVEQIGEIIADIRRRLARNDHAAE